MPHLQAKKEKKKTQKTNPLRLHWADVARAADLVSSRNGAGMQDGLSPTLYPCPSPCKGQQVRG